MQCVCSGCGHGSAVTVQIEQRINIAVAWENNEIEKIEWITK